MGIDISLVVQSIKYKYDYIKIHQKLFKNDHKRSKMSKK